MNYSFHPAAAAEYLETVAFYESKQPGLGAAYLAEFENAMKHVHARSGFSPTRSTHQAIPFA